MQIFQMEARLPLRIHNRQTINILVMSIERSYAYHRLWFSPRGDTDIVKWRTKNERYSGAPCVDTANLISVVEEDGDKGLRDAYS